MQGDYNESGDAHNTHLVSFSTISNHSYRLEAKEQLQHSIYFDGEDIGLLQEQKGNEVLWKEEEVLPEEMGQAFSAVDKAIEVDAMDDAKHKEVIDGLKVENNNEGDKVIFSKNNLSEFIQLSRNDFLRLKEERWATLEIENNHIEVICRGNEVIAFDENEHCELINEGNKANIKRKRKPFDMAKLRICAYSTEIIDKVVNEDLNDQREEMGVIQDNDASKHEEQPNEGEEDKGEIKSEEDIVNNHEENRLKQEENKEEEEGQCQEDKEIKKKEEEVNEVEPNTIILNNKREIDTQAIVQERDEEKEKEKPQEIVSANINDNKKEEMKEEESNLPENNEDINNKSIHNAAESNLCFEAEGQLIIPDQRIDEDIKQESLVLEEDKNKEQDNEAVKNPQEPEVIEKGIPDHIILSPRSKQWKNKEKIEANESPHDIDINDKDQNAKPDLASELKDKDQDQPDDITIQDQDMKDVDKDPDSKEIIQVQDHTEQMLKKDQDQTQQDIIQEQDNKDIIQEQKEEDKGLLNQQDKDNKDINHDQESKKHREDSKDPIEGIDRDKADVVESAFINQNQELNQSIQQDHYKTHEQSKTNETMQDIPLIKEQKILRAKDISNEDEALKKKEIERLALIEFEKMKKDELERLIQKEVEKRVKEQKERPMSLTLPEIDVNKEEEKEKEEKERLNTQSLIPVAPPFIDLTNLYTLAKKYQQGRYRIIKSIAIEVIDLPKKKKSKSNSHSFVSEVKKNHHSLSKDSNSGELTKLRENLSKNVDSKKQKKRGRCRRTLEDKQLQAQPQPQQQEVLSKEIPIELSKVESEESSKERTITIEKLPDLNTNDLLSTHTEISKESSEETEDFRNRTFNQNKKYEFHPNYSKDSSIMSNEENKTNTNFVFNSKLHNKKAPMKYIPYNNKALRKMESKDSNKGKVTIKKNKKPEKHTDKPNKQSKLKICYDDKSKPLMVNNNKPQRQHYQSALSASKTKNNKHSLISHNDTGNNKTNTPSGNRYHNNNHPIQLRNGPQKQLKPINNSSKASSSELHQHTPMKKPLSSVPHKDNMQFPFNQPKQFANKTLQDFNPVTKPSAYFPVSSCCSCQHIHNPPYITNKELNSGYEYWLENHKRKTMSSKTSRGTSYHLNNNSSTINTANLNANVNDQKTKRNSKRTFSNLTEEEIERKRKQMIDLLKDPQNPYSTHWQDKVLGESGYGVGVIANGTINNVPVLTIVKKKEEPTEEKFNKIKSELIRQKSLESSKYYNKSSLNFHPCSKEGINGFDYKKLDNYNHIEYPSIFKYFN